MTQTIKYIYVLTTVKQIADDRHTFILRPPYNLPTTVKHSKEE